MKKFAVFCAGLIGLSSVAEAGVLGAILSTAGQAGHDAAMTRYQANEIMQTAAMLMILSQTGNGGKGKELTLAESGEKIKDVCNVDMWATKEGVVTITFGETCVTPKGDTVDMPAVMEQVQKVGKERISCKEKRCIYKMEWNN